MPIIKNNTQPLVVPFEFNGEDQLAIHRDFWRLPISAGAKGFYLVMLSQEPNKTFSVEETCELSYDLTPSIVHNCMEELSSVGLNPHNVRGWEHA